LTEPSFAGRGARHRGSGGIGSAISRALAASDATVSIRYARNVRAASELAREIGAGGQPFAADMSDPAAPARLVGQVERGSGRST